MRAVKIISAQLTPEQTTWFNKRLNENHRTVTEFVQVIIDAYMNFEKLGYLSSDGTKMDKLQNEVFLRERLRAVQAGILQDRNEAEVELNRIKEEERKRKALDRAHRRAPKVDWGPSAGGYVEGAGFELGDR